VPNSSPIVLLLPQQSDLAAKLGLPDHDDNIFQRIIRNPHIEALYPRERECTEMLCAVLRNTRVLQQHVLRWMADLAGLHIKRFGKLRFEFETEVAIGGGKRIDLYIEGWRETEDERARIVLWTVEVKVGASFHDSTPLDGVNVLDEDPKPVNQVVNYDHWLDHQPIQNRTGFVLALDELSNSLPANLNCQWQCLSWTKLGLKLQEVLQNTDLPASEKFLVKHLLGFIANHLWRDSEMPDLKLNFDDVALVRASAAIGRDCEDKINRLVESIKLLLIQSELGVGDITHEKALYKASQRSIIYRHLFDHEHLKQLYVCAGIADDQITLWLETASRNPNKPVIGSVIESLLPTLKGRNSDWRTSKESGLIDLEINRPLANLLAANDQVSEFENFFNAALEDLKETGLINQLEERLTS
jgi:hypothetical protein